MTEIAERRLVGCIYGQRNADGARLASTLDLAPEHFDDPLCAALYRAAVERAAAPDAQAPLFDPDVMPAVARHIGREVELTEISQLVDEAPVTIDHIPGLADRVRKAWTRKMAAHAAAEAVRRLDDGDLDAGTELLRGAVAIIDLRPGATQRPRPLAELAASPDSGAELIRDRFLCRGGAALLVGPTGAGKSSLAMQAAILWALRVAAFGLMPAFPLRVLIVQAENDDGDLAEMRDGVLAGLNLRDADRDAALSRISVMTEDTKTREAFAAMLDRTLEQNPADLLIIDPAFAYLGGDASSQKDVSPFLRNMLNPILHKHQVGLLLVHHANKPQAAQGNGKKDWTPGDYAYLGAGSAEFANWARAVVALQATSDAALYRMILPKRGRRAGWKDDNGRPTTARYIAYHRDGSTICWETVSDEDAARRTERRAKITVQDVVNVLGSQTMTIGKLQQALMLATAVSHNPARDIIYEAERQKIVTIGSALKGGGKPVRSTGKLQPQGNEEEPRE